MLTETIRAALRRALRELGFEGPYGGMVCLDQMGYADETPLPL